MRQTVVKEPKKKARKTKGSGGAKKTAAKRKPEPVPVDPLVVGIADMPSVPALRHALVSWGTGQGHQADLDVALLARELCEKHCHFCGEESSTTLRLGTPWDQVVLCACLEHASLGITEYTGMMRALERPKAEPQGATPRDAFTRTYGEVQLLESPYQEHLPHWRERIPELMDLAKERRISPDQAIYSNRCEQCATPFSVTARVIVNSVKKYGAHKEMHYCYPCRESFLARREKPEESGPRRPRNKRVATTGDDATTLGDVLGNALAKLQQEEAS